MLPIREPVLKQPDLGVVGRERERRLREVEQGVRGCLGAAAKAELGQDVADVVARGLGADEQACGDLRVRQSLRNQAQYLEFSPRERPSVARSGAALDAEFTKEGGGPVGLCRRSHAVEGVECAPGLRNGEATIRVDE